MITISGIVKRALYNFMVMS